jgi:serine/threonine protein kinase
MIFTQSNPSHFVIPQSSDNISDSEVDMKNLWEPQGTSKQIHKEMSLRKYPLLENANIQYLKGLGEGEFGQVHHGEWSRDDGKVLQVAVKELKRSATEEERTKLLREAALMGQFKHRHVVRLYGVANEGKQVSLIMEHLEGGDLKKYLQAIKRQSGRKSGLEKKLLRFCTHIADAMAYLSGRGFIHRDLAARNILLNENLQCKIADFGMSRDLEGAYYYRSKGGRIPLKWTAPEAILYRKYSTKSDVWSYGMVMYEIWSLGHKPFEGMSNENIKLKLMEGQQHPPPPGCPMDIYIMMVKCWNPKHQDRPSFREILEEFLHHPTDIVAQVHSYGNAQEFYLGAPLENGLAMYQHLQRMYSPYTYVTADRSERSTPECGFARLDDEQGDHKSNDPYENSENKGPTSTSAQNSSEPDSHTVVYCETATKERANEHIYDRTRHPCIQSGRDSETSGLVGVLTGTRREYSTLNLLSTDYDPSRTTIPQSRKHDEDQASTFELSLPSHSCNPTYESIPALTTSEAHEQKNKEPDVEFHTDVFFSFGDSHPQLTHETTPDGHENHDKVDHEGEQRSPLYLTTSQVTQPSGTSEENFTKVVFHPVHEPHLTRPSVTFTTAGESTQYEHVQLVQNQIQQSASATAVETNPIYGPLSQQRTDQDAVYNSGQPTKHEQVHTHLIQDYAVQGISPVYESLPRGGEPTDQTGVYTSGKSTKHEHVHAHQLDYTVQGISPVYQSLPQCGAHTDQAAVNKLQGESNPIYASLPHYILQTDEETLSHVGPLFNPTDEPQHTLSFKSQLDECGDVPHPVYGHYTPVLTRTNPMYGSFHVDHPPRRKLIFDVKHHKK